MKLLFVVHKRKLKQRVIIKHKKKWNYYDKSAKPAAWDEFQRISSRKEGQVVFQCLSASKKVEIKLHQSGTRIISPESCFRVKFHEILMYTPAWNYSLRYLVRCSLATYTSSRGSTYFSGLSHTAENGRMHVCKKHGARNLCLLRDAFHIPARVLLHRTFAPRFSLL